MWADVAHTDGVLREHAIRRHADLYGLDIVGGLEGLSAPVKTSGPATTRLLIDAGTAAAAAKAGRAHWCVHYGAGVDRDVVDLDAVATACDRALLASRLLALDAETEVRIEAPYADFSDRQLVELATDLDAPLDTCWWAIDDKKSPTATAARLRWTRALEAAGLGDLLVS